MCGILVSLSRVEIDGKHIAPLNGALEKLRVANTTRGPDAQNTVKTNVPSRSHTQDNDHQEKLILECFASELFLRGDSLITQPHNKEGFVLCWNGEIFDGMEISVHENDGVSLFDELQKKDSAEEISTLLGTIEGPYAFAFYHPRSHALYFARDPLGRRSLLIHRPTRDQPCFILSSVSNGPDDILSFEELETSSIYCLRLLDLCTASDIVEGWDRCLTKVTRTPEPQRAPGLPYALPSRVNPDLPNEKVPEVSSLEFIPDYLQSSVDRLIGELSKSVMLQIRNIPQRHPGDARVAILFSGGIDSTALCYFADKHIPKDEPIDLLNVAFENPRKIRVRLEGNPDALPKDVKREKRKQAQCEHIIPYDASYMVPDRESGLEEVEELRRVCPGRIWNFVEINVPYEETQKAKAVVESIMFPSRTVMDLSLALALWFASGGAGVIKTDSQAKPMPYTSTARVLLNGLGSDELLGGYGRHRSAFNSGGWSAVVEELQLEIDRIPARNLGRDDRIVSSHGKETRHPFLSLDIVSFLAALPVHHKVDPRLKVGLGDKLLLRLAMRKVGLEIASSRKKRAMQFGSHSARMEGERRGDVTLE